MGNSDSDNPLAAWLSPGPPNYRQACRWLRSSYRRAFTIVELVVVVLILGILAAIAVPRLLSTSYDAQINTLVRHVQVGQDAAARYFGVNGKYPGDASPAAFPSDFKNYLPDNYFSGKVPGGGKWDWNGDGKWGAVYAGMSVFNNNPPLDLWQAIDDRFDDGDLKTGAITLFNGKTLQFELEP